MTETERPLVILARHADGSVEELPAERIDEIDQLTSRPGMLVWVSATTPDDQAIAAFGHEFGLHPLAMEDLRKQRQRPKVDTYANQHMIVAYEVVDAADAGLSEIHIFCGPGWLLTVSWAPTPMLDQLQAEFANGSDRAGADAGGLLYAVLDAAVDSYFPELDRLSDRIDHLEDRVLEGDVDPAGLREILRVKRRLLELRRVLAPMRDVANQLLRRDNDLVDSAALPYYQDLYDHLVRVMDQLDVYRDLLATVLDARLTVASNGLNAIMKRLTAFTVVLMVPTLIAGVYGMNFDRMPELDWPLGYPFALALMLLSVGVAVTWFRRRGWF